MTKAVTPLHYSDQVLVASPNVVVRERLLESLRTRARRVGQAHGGAEALQHLEKGGWQMLVLDSRLPDIDAAELSQTVRQQYPEVQVVLLDDETGLPDRGERQAASGAVTSNAPPNDGTHDQVTSGVSSAVRNQGANTPDELARVSRAATLPGMVGHSAVMQPMYRMVRLVAPRDTTVLITGPTGSGKELVARALHELSPRSAGAFTVVNCAAIPETLLEAELFGYSRGAFTGAMQSYAGRIQAAHMGTLFLDEIGEMPLNLQPKLLRFLEQKELQRLGSSQVVRVNTRVVSATNADLVSLVREGKFREDLFYRLSAFPLVIPPLCERSEDIVELARHFLQKNMLGTAAPVLSEEALALLRNHPWRGNVRELQNVMERAMILIGDELIIRASHLLFSEPNVTAVGHLRG